MSGDFIRIVLVDDHAVVRAGYRRLFERCVDLRVAGEAGTVDALLGLLQTEAVDVVVMDIALPGVSGIEGTRRLRARHPEVQVLISSMHEDAIFPVRAREAGALGYVSKSSPPENLLDGVRRVAKGQGYLSPDIARAVAARERGAGPGSALSPREFEILRHLVAGRSLENIASLLSLSPKTVANHQSHLRQKLGAESSAQLFRAAAALGLDTGLALDTASDAGEAPERTTGRAEDQRRE